MAMSVLELDTLRSLMTPDVFVPTSAFADESRSDITVLYRFRKSTDPFAAVLVPVLVPVPADVLLVLERPLFASAI